MVNQVANDVGSAIVLSYLLAHRCELLLKELDLICLLLDFGFALLRNLLKYFSDLVLLLHVSASSSTLALYCGFPDPWSLHM